MKARRARAQSKDPAKAARWQWWCNIATPAHGQALTRCPAGRPESNPGARRPCRPPATASRGTPFAAAPWQWWQVGDAEREVTPQPILEFEHSDRMHQSGQADERRPDRGASVAPIPKQQPCGPGRSPEHLVVSGVAAAVNMAVRPPVPVGVDRGELQCAPCEAMAGGGTRL
jgi:hypothetical protein